MQEKGLVVVRKSHGLREVVMVVAMAGKNHKLGRLVGSLRRCERCNLSVPMSASSPPDPKLPLIHRTVRVVAGSRDQ